MENAYRSLFSPRKRVAASHDAPLRASLRRFGGVLRCGDQRCRRAMAYGLGFAEDVSWQRAFLENVKEGTIKVENSEGTKNVVN